MTSPLSHDSVAHSSPTGFTVEHVEALAQLSRISITQEEKEVFASEISSILGYISQIQDASALGDIDRTSAQKYPHRNCMREDVPRDTPLVTDPHVLVDLAPRHVDGYVQVKKILGTSD